MKAFDSLVPYVLGSMHPIMHMTLLSTALIQLLMGTEKFYQFPGTCPAGTDAAAFIAGGAEQDMFYIMQAHLICIILHYLYQVLNHYDVKTIANAVLVLKILIYFYAVMSVQTSITFEECTDVTDRSIVMAWLTYEVLAFYFNIIAVVFFLAIAGCKKFKTIRERSGFAGNMRKKTDFLQYVREDLHWWQAWFIQVMLAISGVTFRTNKELTIGLSVTQTFVVLVLGAVLIRNLYFNSKFQFKQHTNVLLGTLVLVNLMLIPRYTYLYGEGSIWWAAIVLEIIVCHIFMFIQMAIEYKTWEEKLIKWKKELMFLEQYQSTDYSENHLRDKINDLQINTTVIDESILDLKQDPSDKSVKVGASYFSAAYHGLMKANREKLKLTHQDQLDLFYRCCFIHFIQILFLFVLFVYAGLKFTYIRNTDRNFILFFSMLLLHLTCLPTAKDGMTMMKYVLTHADEFDHPVAAFVVGWFTLSSLVAAEIVNIANCQGKKSITDAITGFIGYKAVIDLPTVYMNSLEDFDVKGCVGKLTFKRSREKDQDRPRIPLFDKLFNGIYTILNTFYRSVFFYFFPFAIILYPMVKSLEENVQR